MGQKYVERLSEWHESIGPLHSAAKIAILDLCIPTLKQLSESEYERLMQMLDWVIAADEKVDLFEFMLSSTRCLGTCLVTFSQEKGGSTVVPGRRRGFRNPATFCFP